MPKLTLGVGYSRLIRIWIFYVTLATVACSARCGKSPARRLIMLSQCGARQDRSIARTWFARWA
jgi:hypothetical protein